MHGVILEKFIASFREAPEELVLDFDATNDPLHGRPKGRFFHGYYDNYCYLPLYVFCGERLLVSYLRPSKIDESKHGGAVLKLLVKRLRQAWPQVRIVMRADSGFCRRRILAWCERNAVGYIIGLAKNKRLNAMTQPHRERLGRQFALSGVKQREFAELYYGGRTRKRARRVIARLEHMDKGDNPATSSPTSKAMRDPCTRRPTAPAARWRTASRGHSLASSPIAQAASASPPTSFAFCSRASPTSLPSGCGRSLWRGTEFARLQATTLRAKLLKIGAVILRNTRRVRVMLSSAFPYRAVYLAAASALDST